MLLPSWLRSGEASSPGKENPPKPQSLERRRCSARSVYCLPPEPSTHAALLDRKLRPLLVPAGGEPAGHAKQGRVASAARWAARVHQKLLRIPVDCGCPAAVPGPGAAGSPLGVLEYAFS
eukprot:scaffold26102_cov47-Prasinocladus_malaysianus.AAC.1